MTTFEGLSNEEIVERLNQLNASLDFAALNNIKLTELKEGYCKAKLTVKKEHLNIFDAVHGGALFSLADSAAGSAVATLGINSVTLNSSITFLRPAINETYIYAEANVIKSGKNIINTQVSIIDEDGVELARAIFANVRFHPRKVIPGINDFAEDAESQDNHS